MTRKGSGVQIDDTSMKLWSFIFQHMLNPKKPGDTRYFHFFPPKIQNPRWPPKNIENRKYLQNHKYFDMHKEQKLFIKLNYTYMPNLKNIHKKLAELRPFKIPKNGKIHVFFQITS